MTVAKRKKLEGLFAERGFEEFTWIDPREIVVTRWVRMKCVFGCDGYGRNATCPPNTPSVEECRRFFDEYRVAALFHFQKRVAKPELRKPWARKTNARLLAIEREVFLAGHQRAFLLPMDSCELCAECPGARAECRHPKAARPTPESLAVDVFATVRRYGLPIEVLADYRDAMNRYAILLVE